MFYILVEVILEGCPLRSLMNFSHVYLIEIYLNFFVPVIFITQQNCNAKIGSCAMETVYLTIKHKQGTRFYFSSDSSHGNVWSLRLYSVQPP